MHTPPTMSGYGKHHDNPQTLSLYLPCFSVRMLTLFFFFISPPLFLSKILRPGLLNLVHIFCPLGLLYLHVLPFISSYFKGEQAPRKESRVFNKHIGSGGDVSGRNNAI